MAAGPEAGGQLAPVLDDPVVDDGDPAAAVQMGVGVHLRGVAVGGPTGVADTGRRPRRGRSPRSSGGPRATGCRWRPGPGRGPRPRARATPAQVVAAVLEPLQAVEKEPRTPGHRGSDDAAHGPRLAAPLGIEGRARPRRTSGRPPGPGHRLVRRLDRDPDQRLGPTGPEEDPAPVAQVAPSPPPPRTGRRHSRPPGPGRGRGRWRGSGAAGADGGAGQIGQGVERCAGRDRGGGRR